MLRAGQDGGKRHILWVGKKAYTYGVMGLLFLLQTWLASFEYEQRTFYSGSRMEGKEHQVETDQLAIMDRDYIVILNLTSPLPRSLPQLS